VTDALLALLGRAEHPPVHRLQGFGVFGNEDLHGYLRMAEVETGVNVGVNDSTLDDHAVAWKINCNHTNLLLTFFRVEM
jgi:hypothetical protein